MNNLTDRINSLMNEAQAMLTAGDMGIHKDIATLPATFSNKVEEAHKILVEEKESYSEQDWKESVEKYYTRLKEFELERKDILLPMALFEIENVGTNVEYEKALEVLQHTVIYALEGENKGSKFPAFHEYFDMDGDDVEPEKIGKLNEEFRAIKKAFSEKNAGLEIGLMQDGNYVRVRNLLKKHHASPHAPWIIQQNPIRLNYNPRQVIDDVITMGLQECDKALEKECGFGKYSKK